MSGVQAYIDKHGLTKVVEDAINATVKEQPEEPLAFMSAFLSKKTPAAVTAVVGRQVIDSRGNPTVECTVTTYKGSFTAIVPSGASTGIYEAVELRDGGDAWMGKGVTKAVGFLNEEIGPSLIGKDPTDQAGLDAAMIKLDGTDNKGRLGANAILAASMALCKAGAAEKGIPLYKHIAELAGNPKVTIAPTAHRPCPHHRRRWHTSPPLR